ncbi:MAG: PDZ domain-containing protein [Alteromonadaceae bacterium]|nr:PDZ domain-containing protein [Alteromonadaceae bacterium]
MNKLLISIITGLLPISGTNVSAAENNQDRRARWLASFAPQSPTGREITLIEPESALQKTELQKGDIIIAVDGQLVTDGNVWWEISYGLRANKNYRITYKRNGVVSQTDVTFEPAPKESYSGLEVDYDFFVNDFNIKQRSIITYPSNTSTKLPAIFIVGGLSCSSMEYLPGRKSNFVRSVRNLIEQSGMLVKRIEKPGVGDSEGDCSKTDFHVELNGIEVALQQLLKHPLVDSNRVIVYGSSMGSALAPYLANKYKLNGIIADGTFYRSWFEHMLEIERRIKTMQGKTQEEVNELINKVYIPLYYGMLIEKKTYKQVVDSNPLLAEHNYHGDAHMYGRPVSYYHQVQDFNFAGEWSKLTVPAKIRWGTNDWIMSEYDIDMIAEVLTKNNHQNFEVYKFPGLDHWDTIHEAAIDSFSGKPGKWDERISNQLIRWAKELNAKANQQ